MILNLPCLMRRLAAVALLAALTACATKQVTPYDYTALKQSKPASLLLLPPVNDTPDVGATYSVLAQMTLPLAESGYYVLPVSLVDETLRQNGMVNAPEIHAIDPAKLREIFGADAAVYVTVKRYGSVYKVIASETAVAVEARVVDLRSGKELWKGSAVASSAEQSNNSQGGIIGLLVKAVIEQVVNNLSERSHPMAGIASQRLLGAGRPNGLLYGPRSPLYGSN
ncbi:DUF799 domain-containing protein [soil metagenome]